MKILPTKSRGVLQRFCKQCGKEYNPNKKGRLCPACVAENKKGVRKIYYWANKKKESKASSRWAKVNPEKNREKALRHYHKKKLLIRAKKLASIHNQ